MQLRAALFVVLAALFIGYAHSSGSRLEHWSYELYENASTNVFATGSIAEEGSVIGWRISWDLFVYDFAQIGPYRITTNDGTVIYNRDAIKVRADDGFESTGIRYKTIDPCVHRVLDKEVVLDSFELRSNATEGIVNITKFRDVLPIIGQNSARSTIPLSCPAQCSQYVLFNTTTELTTFYTELKITSTVTTVWTYTSRNDYCIETDPHFGLIFVNANTPYTVQFQNQDQIWLLFDMYQPANPEKDNVVIEWNVIAGKIPGKTNEVLWGVLASVLGLVFLVLIVVVVLIIRKKRAYSQMQ